MATIKHVRLFSLYVRCRVDTHTRLAEQFQSVEKVSACLIFISFFLYPFLPPSLSLSFRNESSTEVTSTSLCQKYRLTLALPITYTYIYIWFITLSRDVRSRSGRYNLWIKIIRVAIYCIKLLKVDSSIFSFTFESLYVFIDNRHFVWYIRYWRIFASKLCKYLSSDLQFLPFHTVISFWEELSRWIFNRSLFGGYRHVRPENADLNVTLKSPERSRLGFLLLGESVFRRWKHQGRNFGLSVLTEAQRWNQNNWIRKTMHSV